MPVSLKSLLAVRPYLFHTTPLSNLDGIRNDGALFAASATLYAARRGHEIRVQRLAPTVVEGEGRRRTLMDQRLLHAENLRLEGGWSYEDLLQSLNERVFFWPGTKRGPIRSGLAHFERSRKVGLPIRVLRIPTEELIAANVTPKFSSCSSGAPRGSHGKPARRGPTTFMDGHVASFSASDVVEVAFRDRVFLPKSATIANDPGGPWRAL